MCVLQTGMSLDVCTSNWDVTWCVFFKLGCHLMRVLQTGMSLDACISNWDVTWCVYFQLGCHLMRVLQTGMSLDACTSNWDVTWCVYFKLGCHLMRLLQNNARSFSIVNLQKTVMVLFIYIFLKYKCTHKPVNLVFALDLDIWGMTLSIGWPWHWPLKVGEKLNH